MECPHKSLAAIIATAPAYYHTVARELHAIDPTHTPTTVRKAPR